MLEDIDELPAEDALDALSFELVGISVLELWLGLGLDSD